MKFIRYFIILLSLSLGHKMHAQTKEYLLKASFLEKFANFTVWPNSENTKEFIITIIGDSPFGTDLNELYKNRTINNQPIKIKYVNTVYQIGLCHILFICTSETDNLKNILSYTENKPILTVSESSGFAKMGVLINFYQTEKGTIHFEMNAKKIKHSGLSVDAMLLDYAKIVN